MEENLFLVYKNLGETPLEALERLRLDKNLGDIPLTYAGRLDPAAEGLLLILGGETCKEKDTYLGLPKVYTAQILFGITTDTHDLLGIPASSLHVLPDTTTFANSLENILQTYPSTFIQPYPAYASKTVRGKPLFTYAREGEVVLLPEHEVTMHAITLEKIEEITSADIGERVTRLLSLIKGDFRQEAIGNAWKEILHHDRKYCMATVTLTVSSGFYVRVFADTLGKELGTPAALFSLIRTQVGSYTLDIE
ncbi:hypothetical protein IPF86_02290 [Candidatus Nomurabacteria bacterium]|nr:MAG: hypothetical protein IPF86_02290 [Candidatus Nomurabacteria bacterium]